MKTQFNENLKQLKFFVSDYQLRSLQDIFKGDESEFATETAAALANIINTMPGTYETEETETPDKIVYLHYFKGGSDFYIIEKDKGSDQDPEPGKQFQAWGYAVLNGDHENAEFGYINIHELINNGVELDFNFKPVKFKELGLKEYN